MKKTLIIIKMHGMYVKKKIYIYIQPNALHTHTHTHTHTHIYIYIYIYIYISTTKLILSSGTRESLKDQQLTTTFFSLLFWPTTERPWDIPIGSNAFSRYVAPADITISLSTQCSPRGNEGMKNNILLHIFLVLTFHTHLIVILNLCTCQHL